MVRVLVDGDACPVKEEIYQLHSKYHFDWWIFIDVSHILEMKEAHVIYCDKQRDSADLALMKEAKKDDIVVTSDLGLAAYALARGCQVIDFNGRLICSEAIDALLMERAINQKDRRQKKFTKRPKPRTKKDDETFYLALMKLLEEQYGY